MDYTLLRGPEIGLIILGCDTVDEVHLRGWIHMAHWTRYAEFPSSGYEEEVSMTFLVPSTQVISVSLPRENDNAAKWYNRIRAAMKKRCGPTITWRGAFLPLRQWDLLSEDDEKTVIEQYRVYSSFLCDFDRNEYGQRQGFSSQYHLPRIRWERNGRNEPVVALVKEIVPLIKEVTFYWKNRRLSPNETQKVLLELQDCLQDILKFPKDICTIIVHEWTYVFPPLRASLDIHHTIFKTVPLPNNKELIKLFLGQDIYERDPYASRECIESFSSNISHFDVWLNCLTCP